MDNTSWALQDTFEILGNEIAPEIAEESSRAVETNRAASVRLQAEEDQQTKAAEVTSTVNSILEEPEKLIAEIQDKTTRLLHRL